MMTNISGYLETNIGVKDVLDTEKDGLFDHLVATIAGETLNAKVNRAITHREQGHFDKAMLNMSEANRDQVLAIRKTQQILDKLRGKSYEEVIFSKYRQFLPLEIGIENGEDVLQIINGVMRCNHADMMLIKGEVHALESASVGTRARLAFFEDRLHDGDEIDEIESMKNALARNAGRSDELKMVVVDQIISVLKETVESADQFKNSMNVLAELVLNIFYIVMSPIATKDARTVPVE